MVFFIAKCVDKRFGTWYYINAARTRNEPVCCKSRLQLRGKSDERREPMIILCILLAVLGGVVVYASERENSIFFNVCIRLAGTFLLVIGIRLMLYV